MFVADGLSGMPDAIREVFPNALHQRCIVHYLRNLKSYARRSEMKEICSDFHKVYASKTRKDAIKEFDSFIELWGREYVGLRNMLSKTDDNIFSCYSFPEKIRLGLYTSNGIKAFNLKLKREARKLVLMSSESNATIVITAICKTYNGSKLGRRMNGLSEVPIEVRRELGFNF